MIGYILTKTLSGIFFSVLLILLISSLVSCFLAAGVVGESIPGVPGRDYPTYNRVPETFFSCRGQVDGGYYADPETRCQSFHVCADNGTGGLIQVKIHLLLKINI